MHKRPMFQRICISGILGLALAATSVGQSWISSYDAGLKAARAGNWLDARKSFQLAKANRPDDASKPTSLPGPATEKRTWRNGAPYSPNFLAAYSSYRQGLTSKDDQASVYLKQAAEEFEMLVGKKQVSQESVFFLNAIYGKLGQNDKRQALAAKAGAPNWKVDTEVVAPEELSMMATPGNPATTSGGNNGGVVQTINANQVPNAPTGTSYTGGPVIYAPKKFALIIANGDNRLPGAEITHAAEDARLVKDAITMSAGYDPANTEIVVNGTAEQIKKTAAALASRMPEEGVLLLFFTGAATNIDGRDWLAGVDTELPTDTSTMVSKTDLYKIFTSKGTSIFSFYQVARPITAGRFFGSEEPKVGRISQMQATIPGDSIYSLYRNGKTVGIFADAMSQVFGELHSNAIPISDFGWQVFYKIRRGTTGDAGGGSRQTPTLPVTLLLASNARF